MVSRVSAYLRGFDTEALLVGVDRDDPDRYASVDRPGLLVRETGAAVGFDERAERYLFGHHALDEVADLVASRELLPAHVSPGIKGGSPVRRGREEAWYGAGACRHGISSI
ncbi:hypothetical protein, partial [Actinoplanes campanulatus]|uniref:hypothetical protein n=1 Tax=Actinoplanes campanulatus TaxID=113559 RepID=UPI001C857E65